MTAGGGLDLRVRRHFAIRIIQAEYLMTRFRIPPPETARRRMTCASPRESSSASAEARSAAGDPGVLGQSRFGLPRRPGHSDGDGRQSGTQAECDLQPDGRPGLNGDGATATVDSAARCLRRAPIR